MAKKNQQIKDRKPIIKDAMLYYYLEFEFDVMKREDVRELFKHCDINKISDRTILFNPLYQEELDWNSLANSKIARLISMFIDRGEEDQILNKVDLKSKNFKIKEVIWCLARTPELAESVFGFDLNNLKRTEAYSLLKFGHEYFLDRIDFKNYKFNLTESYKIAKAYQFDRKVMLRLNTMKFEGYHVAEVMMTTGRENIDIMNLRKLKAQHWIDVLEKRRTLKDLCPDTIFHTSDIYYTIKFFLLFPEKEKVQKIIEARNNEITEFGWEILLSKQPNEFIELCNYNLLYETTWRKILNAQPHLEQYRPMPIKKFMSDNF